MRPEAAYRYTEPLLKVKLVLAGVPGRSTISTVEPVRCVRAETRPRFLGPAMGPPTRSGWPRIKCWRDCQVTHCNHLTIRSSRWYQEPMKPPMPEPTHATVSQLQRAHR
jgi:hypothetical protein